MNINTEMNYWPAEVANLSECAGPLFDLISDVAHRARRSPRNITGPGLGPPPQHRPLARRRPHQRLGSRHLAHRRRLARHHLWDHYLYTGDRRVPRGPGLPEHEGRRAFFVDFLVKDPKTGWLISGPSNSPEQGGLVMGPTMDHQIIRDLFANTVKAAELLGRDSDFAAQLKDLRPRSLRTRSAAMASSRSGSRTRTTRRTSTGTSRTSGACIPAGRSPRTPRISSGPRGNR